MSASPDAPSDQTSDAGSDGHDVIADHDDGSASGSGWVGDLARVTGLLLVVLLAVHAVSILVRDPEELDGVFFIDRWSSVGWLFADWGFLLVASVHGVLALRPRLRDQGAPGRLLFGMVAGCTALLFLAASWAMLDYA